MTLRSIYSVHWPVLAPDIPVITLFPETKEKATLRHGGREATRRMDRELHLWLATLNIKGHSAFGHLNLFPALGRLMTSEGNQLFGVMASGRESPLIPDLTIGSKLAGSCAEVQLWFAAFGSPTCTVICAREQ